MNHGSSLVIESLNLQSRARNVPHAEQLSLQQYLEEIGLTIDCIDCEPEFKDS